jgi:hypothetical protein
MLMERARRKAALGFLLPALLLAPGARAQQQRVPQEKLLRHLLELEKKLTPQQISHLSSGFNNYLAFAHSVLDPQTAGPDDDGQKPPFALAQSKTGGTSASATRQSAPLNGAAIQTSKVNGVLNPGQISNPQLDFQLSRFTGFTQNVSSSAWCGHNIVTGFQSSFAEVATGVLVFEQDPNLFLNSSTALGVAFSANDGENFTDLGFLNPGSTTATTNANTAAFGNPVVVCTSPEKFYYLTSPNFVADSSSSTIASIGLNVSVDGGKQWSDPAPIVKKTAFHILDRAWLASDPQQSNRLYAAYFDFDLDGVFPDTVATARCPNVVRQAIELVSSNDGGQTWSAPAIVREDCDAFDPTTGALLVHNQPFAPQVAVGGDGKVFVAYSLFVEAGPQAGTNLLNFRRSTNHGNTFDAEVTVSNIVLAGDQALLQGNIIDVPGPAMAVDTAKNAGKDTIYIAWTDGRDNPQVDVVASTGTYSFGDIVLAKSTDGGATWSTPKAVSPTPANFGGSGRDQFQPAVAVDRAGELAVCYYDKRNDTQNNAVDRFCSISADRGRSFQDIRQTTSSWTPIHNTDFFVSPQSLGLYDTIAPHHGTGAENAFFGSFQIINNAAPNVIGRDIRREQ